MQVLSLCEPQNFIKGFTFRKAWGYFFNHELFFGPFVGHGAISSTMNFSLVLLLGHAIR
jgi:hypothetical protein